MSITLLIVDPQNDFCTTDGALFVPGSDKDCSRLASFIRKNSDKIDSIHVTMDTHPAFHISHPCFWRDENGNEVEPFTCITSNDFSEGKFKPAIPALNPRVEDYLVKLESQGKYKHTIWPPHCLIGTSGHNVEVTVIEAIREWERQNPGKNAHFVFKGINPLTEHYSAIQADVVDHEDPDSKTNFSFIDTLKQNDTIIVAGQALSHCVKNTLTDLFVYIPQSKIKVLKDCTSSVPGYETTGKEFLEENVEKGMELITSETTL